MKSGEKGSTALPTYRDPSSWRPPPAGPQSRRTGQAMGIVRKGSPPGPTVAAEHLLETIETYPRCAHLDLGPTRSVDLPRQGFGSATAPTFACTWAVPVALASLAPALFQA